jgi:hypothetical protein
MQLFKLIDPEWEEVASGIHDAVWCGYLYRVRRATGGWYVCCDGVPLRDESGATVQHSKVELAQAAAKEDCLRRVSAFLRISNDFRSILAEKDDSRAQLHEKTAELRKRLRFLEGVLSTSGAEGQWCDDVTNACPHCGGSGHKGDVRDD